LFIVSSGIELLLCFFLVYAILKTPLKMVFNRKLYISLIKETLPQTGTILLDSTAARLDWILMGILSTKVLTADYSFSYKAFESSRIPLLIIAPVLLPKLSRIYSNDNNLKQENINQLNSLWKAESFICVIIPLLLNICWIDVVNLFTHNKYGVETKWVYMVLSMSLPMLFISNYFWTIAFAKGRLKLTFVISAIVTFSNVILNIVLIPKYNALGAAIASTSSLFIQLVLYAVTVRERELKLYFIDFIKTFFIAGGVVVVMQYVSLFWLTKVCIAIVLFSFIMWRMRIIRYIISIK
jgi:O-antigen/teichoic acid export membrane protein